MEKSCSQSLDAELELTGSRFLVFSNSDASHLPVVEVTREANLRYCKKHGYAWKSTWCSSKVRAIGWAKVAAFQLLARYENFDWILYMDSDVKFTNFTVSLDDIVQCAAKERANIIISADMGGRPMNGGFIMMRRSAAALGLLKQWWDAGTEYGLRNTFAFEQGTLSRLAAESASASRQVAVLPQQCSPHFFNHGFFVPDAMQWQPGDFAVHIAGAKSVSTKLSLLAEVQDQQNRLHLVAAEGKSQS